jgi:class 3 adenylate cyclase
MDVRHALPLINAPTLVLHATRDQTDPVDAARYVAARIPDAKLVELDSADHLIWLTDRLDVMVNEIRDFVQHVAPRDESTRVLATVLDVDVPDGVETDAVTAAIAKHRGTVVRCDDGVLASFDGPARAIRCATSILTKANNGLRVRAGLHSGECELMGAEIGGVAVQIARQLTKLAPPFGVVVSQTVRDLVVGSDIEFGDYGTHQMEGVPGDWHAYLVLVEKS